MAVMTCVAIPTAHADDYGVQYVRTESGRVRCLITANGQGTGMSGPNVICEASGPDPANQGFTQAPLTNYGPHQHNVITDAAGNFHFAEGGNIGGAGEPNNDVVLQYGQTYHAEGWTISPSFDGTRLTNDRTGHGMFVSIDNSYSI